MASADSDTSWGPTEAVGNSPPPRTAAPEHGSPEEAEALALAQSDPGEARNQFCKRLTQELGAVAQSLKPVERRKLAEAAWEQGHRYWKHGMVAMVQEAAARHQMNSWAPEDPEETRRRRELAKKQEAAAQAQPAKERGAPRQLPRSLASTAWMMSRTGGDGCGPVGGAEDQGAATVDADANGGLSLEMEPELLEKLSAELAIKTDGPDGGGPGWSEPEPEPGPGQLGTDAVGGGGVELGLELAQVDATAAAGEAAAAAVAPTGDGSGGGGAEAKELEAAVDEADSEAAAAAARGNAERADGDDGANDAEDDAGAGELRYAGAAPDSAAGAVAATAGGGIASGGEPEASDDTDGGAGTASLMLP
jgi:hypothetical protein